MYFYKYREKCVRNVKLIVYKLVNYFSFKIKSEFKIISAVVSVLIFLYKCCIIQDNSLR